MKRCAVAGIVILMLGTLLAPAAAQNEPPRIDAHFNGESLGQVLQMLSEAYGLQYTLGRDVNPYSPVYLSLSDVTPQQLLSAVVEASGLVATNRDGRYMIRERTDGRRADVRGAEIVPRPVGVETPSPPARPAPDAGAQRTQAEDGRDAEGEREEILELIWPKYLSADVAAAIFGGTVIPAGGLYSDGYTRGGVRGGSGTGVRGYRGGASGGVSDYTTRGYDRGTGSYRSTDTGRVSSFGYQAR
ncbi:MAG: hypothetical protein ACP5KN_03150 [Armatimonadota bacterium]